MGNKRIKKPKTWQGDEHVVHGSYGGATDAYREMLEESGRDYGAQEDVDEFFDTIQVEEDYTSMDDEQDWYDDN